MYTHTHTVHLPHACKFLCMTHMCKQCISIIYSRVGRSIADIYTTAAPYLPRGKKYVILYVIYQMVSAQQMDLSAWDGWIFPWRHFSLGGLHIIYRTSSQYVISYGCAITIPNYYNIKLYWGTSAHIHAHLEPCTVNLNATFLPRQTEHSNYVWLGWTLCHVDEIAHFGSLSSTACAVEYALLHWMYHALIYIWRCIICQLCIINHYNNYIFHQGEVIKKLPSHSCAHSWTCKLTLIIANPPNMHKFYPLYDYNILISWILPHMHTCIYTLSLIVCSHKDVCSYILFSL